MAEENLSHRPQITVQAPSSSEVVTGSLPTASDDLLSHESSNSLSNDTTQSEALSPGNVLLSPASSPLPSSGSAVPRTANESELSEAELRRLYDDEEIERFLGLFSDVSHGCCPSLIDKQGLKHLTLVCLRSSPTSGCTTTKSRFVADTRATIFCEIIEGRRNGDRSSFSIIIRS